MTNIKKERLWFNLTHKWYTGSFPQFYDPADFPSTKILEDNFQLIKNEIVELSTKEEEILKPNFTRFEYIEPKWRTLDIVSYMMRYKKYERKIPVTMNILSAIPDLVSVHIAVLKPGARVRAHFGDCSGLVRSHLGVVIPGTLPDIGIRVGAYEKSWYEGRVLVFCDAQRHYVWNNTNRDRVILLIDTIHPHFKGWKLYICSGLIAAGIMKIIWAKLPVTKKMPDALVIFFHRLTTICVMPLMVIQKIFNLGYGDIFDLIKHRLF